MNKTTSRGLYLHGPPGRGKTLVADLLVPNPNVTRVHFSYFMSRIHKSLHHLSRSINHKSLSQTDRYRIVAKQVSSTDILLLDELEVTDIADASILTRLLNAMTEQSTILVLTSNRSPEQLYLGGLNYSRFQPEFSTNLRSIVDVLDMDWPVDYRANEGGLSVSERLFFFNPKQSIWANSTAPAPTEIKVAEHLSRMIQIPLASGKLCRFSFDELAGNNCNKSSSCYNAISRHFDVVVVDNVPILESRDDMRRFTMFVDAMYERKKVLVLENVAGTFEEVFGENAEENFSEEEEGKLQHQQDLTVLGEGGSSGRLTTMVAEDLEWSATGRQGASLVDLQTGDFSKLAFSRCRSRLVEMMRKGWGGEK